MLLCLAEVLLRIAPSDEYHAQAVIRVFSMQADQMGGEFVARSALRVTEDQEYAPAPVLRAKPCDLEGRAGEKQARACRL